VLVIFVFIIIYKKKTCVATQDRTGDL